VKFHGARYCAFRGTARRARHLTTGHRKRTLTHAPETAEGERHQQLLLGSSWKDNAPLLRQLVNNAKPWRPTRELLALRLAQLRPQQWRPLQRLCKKCRLVSCREVQATPAATAPFYCLLSHPSFSSSHFAGRAEGRRIDGGGRRGAEGGEYVLRGAAPLHCLRPFSPARLC